MILGVDEVGRGAWAGPLVVGAVVLGRKIAGLNDSKLLSKKNREILSSEIYESSLVGLGWVDNVEIDAMGLGPALNLATYRAVSQIDRSSYDEIIVDGTVNLLKSTEFENFCSTMKKADQLITAVSAASIVAKVARDRHMIELDSQYPEYGFKSHVGYGTKLHRQRLDQFGPSNLHRKTYQPISDMIAKTSRSTGLRAEAVVADYLVSIGHEIIEMNWKTRYCEVDIISYKSNRYYFTEVKYRSNSKYGNGLEVINRSKLSKMKFAANIYMKNFSADYSLSVAAVADEPMKILDWIELD